ncbi:MAG: 16S rRNA (cytosine(967)-C(5))-methyltransferase [Pseudomonadales bacterium]|nr:16S rRNA (cytosine(967)-C(5))-methyltransferase [Pseudomonadales bacterium]
MTGADLNPRARAAQVLSQVLPLGRQQYRARSLAELLPPALAQESQPGLLQELCYGVCRWYNRLDKLAAPLVRQPFRPRDADLQALLLVGLYQMFYLRIPDHAAISETVQACRQLQKDWAARVLNGMLRSAQRQKADLEQSLPQTPAIQQAHPKWLVDMLEAAWPGQAAAILRANNQPGPLCLRVNRQQLSRDAYLAGLRDRHLDARTGGFSDCAIYLAKPVDVAELPGFAEGLVSVQDEAAQLSAQLLDPQPGERILDACAAPGGKTCHLLELQPQLAELVALDQDAQRLQRVRENLTRLQLRATLVHSSLEDYSHEHAPGQTSDATSGGFDRILLDAPCSATGVIRRHPDIKWLRKRSDIRALADTQGRLLEAAFSLLKPGGTLVYATCSVLPQENERVVQSFLARQPQARAVEIAAPWGEARPVGRQLFPVAGQHDGFYYCKLQHADTQAP